MESNSKAQLSNEQMSEILQSLIKNIVTKDDLQQFATRDDISQLEHTVFSGSSEESVTSGYRVAGQAMQRLREQIKENQQAVDNLFLDMASNKKAINELRVSIQKMNQDVVGLQHEVNELNAVIIKAQADLLDRHEELSELIHNVEANTRVVGKIASVVTDVNDRVNETLTNNDLSRFRSEIIQRLDHIVKRLEIYDHEQVSIKVGMKRMEKIQKDEIVRNDKQDIKIKKNMEKIEFITEQIKKTGS